MADLSYILSKHSSLSGETAAQSNSNPTVDALAQLGIQLFSFDAAVLKAQERKGTLIEAFLQKLKVDSNPDVHKLNCDVEHAQSCHADGEVLLVTEGTLCLHVVERAENKSANVTNHTNNSGVGVRVRVFAGTAALVAAGTSARFYSEDGQPVVCERYHSSPSASVGKHKGLNINCACKFEVPLPEAFDQEAELAVRRLHTFSNNARIVFYFTGAHYAVADFSWCPDCVAADPHIKKEISEATSTGVPIVFVHCPVQRFNYINHPEHIYRNHCFVGLPNGIPTVIVAKPLSATGKQSWCDELEVVARYDGEIHEGWLNKLL